MRLLRLLFILLTMQLLAMQLALANETHTKTADELLIAIIEREFSLDTSLTEIEVLRNPIPINAFTEHRIQHLESYNRNPRGLVSMTAYCVTPSGDRVPYGIQVRIRTFDDAYVTTVGLKQRSALESSTCERRRVETTLLTDQVWSATDDLSQVRTSRSIPAGTVITSRLVEPIPLIEAGGLVSIAIETPTVKITTSGTALDAGRIGDRIRVRNQSSGKILTATIRSMRDVVITE